MPQASPSARRVENRIPSSDTNPYLAMAASLACGYLGLTEQIAAKPAIKTTSNEGQIDLPRGLLDALSLFEKNDKLADVLGDEFVGVFAAIKRDEIETFMEVISPWEREHLLLNV